jgi:hypothetical protein
MKKKAPLGSLFIGEPRGDWSAEDGGRVARPCGQSLSIMSQRCGGCSKVGDSGGEMRKGGRRWLAGHRSLADRPCLASTQSLLSSSTSYCSSHAHSTDQNHQKQTQFISSVSKFIFLKFLDFILCNDEINMMWKRSK